jgi:murein hydrolase activator
VKSVVVFLAVLLSAASTLAQQPDQARTEALAARAAERLRVLHEEADRLASEERTLLGDLRRLELQRQIKEEEFKRADDEWKKATAALAEVNAEVEHLEERDRAERPALQARLTELYKLGEARYMRLLLSLSDPRQVVQATRLVSVLAKTDHDRLEAHQKRLGELATSRASLEERGRRLAELKSEVAKAKSALDQAVAERNALVRDIDERRDLNAQLSGELQAAQATLQLRLKGAAQASAAPASLPLRPFKGDLAWPVTGVVRQRFARTSTMTQIASNGIDITAAEGTPVAAVHDGSVAYADTFSGFGKLVIVDHGANTFSIYGNLLEIGVTAGTQVDTGQTLGQVGQSVMGVPGLHFELRIDGEAVDPLQWLKRR